jgi:hypothetical protein
MGAGGQCLPPNCNNLPIAGNLKIQVGRIVLFDNKNVLQDISLRIKMWGHNQYLYFSDQNPAIYEIHATNFNFKQYLHDAKISKV